MPAHASAKQLRFFLRSIQMELITPYNVLIWATISTKGRIIATHDENRETILIVDDSAMNRMLLSDILAVPTTSSKQKMDEQAIAILATTCLRNIDRCLGYGHAEGRWFAVLEP